MVESVSEPFNADETINAIHEMLEENALSEGEEDEEEDVESRQSFSTPKRRRSSIEALVNKGKSFVTAVTTNTTTPSTATTITDREGFMQKRGGGTSKLGSRSWRNRYFVLKDQCLSYYHNAKEYNKGKNPLKGAVYAINLCEVQEDTQTPLVFSVIPKSADAGPRVLVCRCPTEKEATAWVASIRACQTSAWRVKA